MSPGLEKIISDLVGNENVDDFGLWAFGENYSEIYGLSNYAKAWNKLHRDIFKIEMDSPFLVDLIKMIDLWRLYESDV